MIRPRATFRETAMLTLIGLALAVRVLVPAGWMPDQARGFAITLCTGTGAEQVWVDAEGKVHKHAPATAPDHPCAFAGMAAPMLGGEGPVPILLPAAPAEIAALARSMVGIGQGLAAPPPPATGPPVTI